jgi:hypothetical protein
MINHKNKNKKNNKETILFHHKIKKRKILFSQAHKHGRSVEDDLFFN